MPVPWVSRRAIGPATKATKPIGPAAAVAIAASATAKTISSSRDSLDPDRRCPWRCRRRAADPESDRPAHRVSGSDDRHHHEQRLQLGRGRRR